jgi:hypothetical protein
MRENRPYGSEGGEAEKPSLPLSMRDYGTRLNAVIASQRVGRMPAR